MLRTRVVRELFLQLALRPSFSEEREEPIPKRWRQPVGEGLAEAMEADQGLHIAQVLMTVAPDPTGDLEFNQGLHRGKAHPVYFYEYVGIRWGIYNGALVGPGMLTRGHHVNVYLVLGFAQELPQPRAPWDQAPADECGVDLVKPVWRRQDVDILCGPHEAVLTERQGTDDGKGDAFFPQSPAQEFQHEGDILGVHVIPPQKLDQWAGNLLRHAGIVPYVSRERKNIYGWGRAPESPLGRRLGHEPPRTASGACVRLWMPGERRERFLKAAWNIAKRRVMAILEKKHRWAYERAATLVAAVAEARIVAGDPERGRSLLDDIRDQYRRNYAFTGELDKVARRSPLLPSPPSKRQRW